MLPNGIDPQLDKEIFEQKGKYVNGQFVRSGEYKMYPKENLHPEEKKFYERQYKDICDNEAYSQLFLKRKGEPIFDEEAWFRPEFGYGSMPMYEFKDAFFPPVKMTRIPFWLSDTADIPLTEDNWMYQEYKNRWMIGANQKITEAVYKSRLLEEDEIFPLERYWYNKISLLFPKKQITYEPPVVLYQPNSYREMRSIDLKKAIYTQMLAIHGQTNDRGMMYQNLHVPALMLLLDGKINFICIIKARNVRWGHYYKCEMTYTHTFVNYIENKYQDRIRFKMLQNNKLFNRRLICQFDQLYFDREQILPDIRWARVSNEDLLVKMSMGVPLLIRILDGQYVPLYFPKKRVATVNIDGTQKTLPCTQIPDDVQVDIARVYQGFVEAITPYPDLIQNLHQRVPVEALVTYVIHYKRNNVPQKYRLFAYMNTRMSFARFMWGQYSYQGQ